MASRTICNPACRIRKGLEAQNLSGPAPAEVCDQVAIELVGLDEPLGSCPLEQIDVGYEN
jgi:hypothetical protein